MFVSITASVKVCLSSPGTEYCKPVEFRLVQRFQKYVPERKVKLLPSPDRAQALMGVSAVSSFNQVIYSIHPIPIE